MKFTKVYTREARVANPDTKNKFWYGAGSHRYPMGALPRTKHEVFSFGERFANDRMHLFGARTALYNKTVNF